MLYQNVCLEAFAYTLPEEVVTSAEIEALLEPLYTRLRLPEGRLELMTGIAQRRFWPRGMPPSEQSVETFQESASRFICDSQQAMARSTICRCGRGTADRCRRRNLTAESRAAAMSSASCR